TKHINLEELRARPLYLLLNPVQSVQTVNTTAQIRFTQLSRKIVKTISINITS
ncbi:unnamed protein product, partial [Schistosoma haematobium]